MILEDKADYFPGIDPTGRYQLICEIPVDGKRLLAWASRELEDPTWDRFLQQSPIGQFQQSSMWARTKAIQGWKPYRILVTSGNEIVGGFQILWKSSWWGAIGYVDKGPLIPGRRDGVCNHLVALLGRAVRALRLRALIVQPPDSCLMIADKLEADGFMPDFLGKMNSATWILELGDGPEAIGASMTRETHKDVRRATNKGLTIREGGREDIAAFFALMCITCRHQGVVPNPPELKHLLAMWDAFSPAGCIRLYFAEHEGKPLAGHLDFVFGRTVTKWKVGGHHDARRFAPNPFLWYQGIMWAARNAYARCDFAAFDRRLAIFMLTAGKASQIELPGRYRFFTRFGGKPVLLPIAQVYFPNPLLRLAYRLYFRKQLRAAEKEAKTIQDIKDQSLCGASF